MKIVIDITEDVYTRLFDNGIQDNEIAADDVCEMARALRLGTPLPKGHGRLIDADAINTHDVSPIWDMEIYGITEDDIDVEPTIIEADNGGGENEASD